MQQNGMTRKNNTSSRGRLKMFMPITPAGLNRQWPRLVANMSQVPKLSTPRLCF